MVFYILGLITFLLLTIFVFTLKKTYSFSRKDDWSANGLINLQTNIAGIKSSRVLGLKLQYIFFLNLNDFLNLYKVKKIEYSELP